VRSCVCVCARERERTYLQWCFNSFVLFNSTILMLLLNVTTIHFFVMLPYRGHPSDTFVGGHAVGFCIVTFYGLDGLGLTPGGGRILHIHPGEPWATPSPYAVVTGSFLGLKQLRHGINHPPQSSTEVKERVELYLYSPCGSSWPVLSWPLPLPWTKFIWMRIGMNGRLLFTWW
jgi:hypothetical protein